WTAGAGLCAIHMAAAFFGVHRGSVAAMVADTARQTRLGFGLDWGGGADVNRRVVRAWGVEAAWGNAGPEGVARPPSLLRWGGTRRRRRTGAGRHGSAGRSAGCTLW